MTPAPTPAEHISALRAEIAHHNERYYADDAPEVSDADYDHLVRELARLEDEHPELAEPKPVKRPTKGEKAEQKERAVAEQQEKKRRDKWGVSDRGYPTKK